MDKSLMTTAESEQFCDRVKLSEFNQIQLYGGLLVLDRNLRVMQYSENMTTLLGISIQQLLILPLTTFLKSENASEDIVSWLHQANNKYKQLDWQSSQTKLKIWVYIHQTSEGIILEIEPVMKNQAEDNTLFDLAQYVVESMKTTMGCHSVQQVVQTTCDKIQKMTGYHRIIIYKFDEQDQSGIVVAETLQKEMESYKGLHFPATDIPQNVRAMYLKLPLRYIPTILAKSVKIIPEINPVTHTYLDLSNTNLRMVAPVHTQYLTNMGVVSATSIAIIHDNKLWGLIACHHKEPKYLSVNFRLILMLIGNALATQIVALEYVKDFHDEQRTVTLQTELTENISKESSIISALDSYHAQMMKLVSATGMSIYFQGDLINYGETPAYEQALNLISWLKAKQLSSPYATATLPVDFPASSDYKDKVCGLLAVPITGLENHYLLFYRPELIQSIAWAGNPAESLKCHGSGYSPRDSFQRFMETITNHSAPWAHHEIKSANFIRSIVVNKQLQDLLQVQAMHDPLTGLLNRLYLDQRLMLEIKRAERESKPIAVILADLDFFKKINDNFGHQAGDIMLSEFAKLLRSSFRGYDYIYRYGGEEFLLILPGITKANAQQKAETLRAEIKKMDVQFLGKRLPLITISVGISIYPDSGVDARSLIAAADVALYQAKSSGRDKVICASGR